MNIPCQKSNLLGTVWYLTVNQHNEDDLKSIVKSELQELDKVPHTEASSIHANLS